GSNATVVGHRRLRVPRPGARPARAAAGLGGARDLVRAPSGRRCRLGPRRRPRRGGGACRDGRRRRGRPHRLPPGGGRVGGERRRLRGGGGGLPRAAARPRLDGSRLPRDARALPRGRRRGAGRLLRPVEGGGRAAGRGAAPAGGDRAHVAHLRRRRAGAAGAPRTRADALLRRRDQVARPGRRPRRGAARAARARRGGTVARRRRRRRLALRLRAPARRRPGPPRARAHDARPRARRVARQLTRRPAPPDAPARGPRGPRLALPDVLERAEAELLHVVEPRVVAPPQVLGPVLLEERVVRLRRLPPVDHEVALRFLDGVQQLGADVAGPRAEEVRPLALRAVDPLEGLRVAHLVAEDERDQRRPPRSWWARKKFSLPAVAIAAEALISRQSAAAATICARRYTLPSPAQPIDASQSRADGSVVPPPTVPTSRPGKRIVACRPPSTRRAVPCAIDEVPTIPRSCPVAANTAATADAGVNATDCMPEATAPCV